MAQFIVDVGNSRLLLRDGPSTENAILAKLSSGTFVEQVGDTQQGPWIKVQVSIGGEIIVGWVHSDFLDPVGAIHHRSIPVAAFPKWVVGMNIPNFAFYGAGNFSNLPQALQNEQVQVLKDNNVKVVRFFAQHESIDNSIARVSQALTLLGDIQAVLCLIDVFSESGRVLPKDKERNYYNMPTDAGNKLNKTYYTEEAYHAPGSFLTFAQDIVSTLSGKHSNILLWEIGNELTIHAPNTSPNKADGEAFLKFAETATKTIREAAGGRARVGTGLVNSSHVVPSEGFTREDYTELLYKKFDAISLHFYRGENPADFDVDLKIAHKLDDKPVYMGEVGADIGGGERVGFYDEQFHTLKDDKLFMVMPWDLGAPSSPGLGGERGLPFRDGASTPQILERVRAAAAL